jgi:hypothetical protein
MDIDTHAEVVRLISEADKADSAQVTIAVSLLAIARILLHAHDAPDTAQAEE